GGPRYQDFTGEECWLPSSKSTLLSLRILLGSRPRPAGSGVPETQDSSPDRFPASCRPPETQASGALEGSGFLGRHLLFLAPADAGLDETVEVAVEDRRGVVDLIAGAQVLDHLVRVRDIGAHLIAPAGLDVAGELLLLRGLLLTLEVEQAGPEDAHRGLAVLDLGLLVLHAHDHTGGDVGDA